MNNAEKRAAILAKHAPKITPKVVRPTMTADEFEKEELRRFERDAERRTESRAPLNGHWYLDK